MGTRWWPDAPAFLISLNREGALPFRVVCERVGDVTTVIYFEITVASHSCHAERPQSVTTTALTICTLSLAVVTADVQRGLVSQPEHWAWSSFRGYAFGEPG